MVSKVFEHPFDLTKVRLQSQVLDVTARFNGPVDCLGQTWKKEGVKGLYRVRDFFTFSFGCWLLHNWCICMIFRVFRHLLLVLWSRMQVCSCHTRDFRISSVIYPIDHLKRNFLYTIWHSQLLEQVLSPVFSCAFDLLFQENFYFFFSFHTLCFCRTPIELVKCKMQVQMLVMVPPTGGAAVTLGGSVPRNLPGPISMLVSVIRNTGIRGLWLGHTGTFIRETGGTAAWFGTKEYVASLLLARRSHRNSADTQLRPWESAFSGACAGATFDLALFPADTVKSTMQTEEELRSKSKTNVRGMDSSAMSRKATFGGTFMALYRAKGIRGLYAGCGITVARSIPSSAVIFLIYDGLKKYSV